MQVIYTTETNYESQNGKIGDMKSILRHAKKTI